MKERTVTFHYHTLASDEIPTGLWARVSHSEGSAKAHLGIGGKDNGLDIPGVKRDEIQTLVRLLNEVLADWS